MKVRILKPLSNGKNTGFFDVGQVIDFAKDIEWNIKIDVKVQAYDLVRLGYIEILKDQPEKAPEAAMPKPVVQQPIKKINGKK